MDAFLVLDKPQGLSSQQAVTRVRKALGAAKAGHTGTLDPLATGVLPIALGEATKVIPFLDEEKKEYRVEALLGVTTDTYDAEGQETSRQSAAGIARGDVAALLPGFLGEQAQIPPSFSAIKKLGKPLYAYAREGREVEAESRRIRIDSLELESFGEERLVLRVQCSKGTYIRSLVHDLGKALGCGAHVVALRRLASGLFGETQALSLDQVLSDPKATEAKLLSLESCLARMEALPLESEAERDRVRSGVPLHRISQLIVNKELFDRTLTLVFAEKIIALIESKQGGDFSYGRVLNL